MEWQSWDFGSSLLCHIQNTGMIHSVLFLLVWKGCQCIPEQVCHFLLFVVFFSTIEQRSVSCLTISQGCLQTLAWVHICGILKPIQMLPNIEQLHKITAGYLNQWMEAFCLVLLFCSLRHNLRLNEARRRNLIEWMR